MAFTFMRARGHPTGGSLVEEDQIELATRLEAAAKAKGVEFLLPVDYIVAEKFEGGEATAKVVADSAIPEGWLGLDHGPQSSANVKAALSDCKTVLWNGPMGVFEQPAYAKGTFDVAEELARLSDGGLSSPEALGLSALLLVAFGAMNAWGFALLGEACARTGASRTNSLIFGCRTSSHRGDTWASTSRSLTPWR